MFNFKNLDVETRNFMLKAVEEAESEGQIYFSKRFNDKGKIRWLALLKEAVKDYDENWLACRLEEEKLFEKVEKTHKPSGGCVTKHIPNSSAMTLAEGQFNRFYILGLCKRARAENITTLEVYRARESEKPRDESEKLIGQFFAIDDIEVQLKEINASFRSSLVKPNSGISVKIPE